MQGRCFIRRIHLIVGLLGVAVFLGTGAYMRTLFPGAYQSNEVVRYLYRANHVYLLFASLLNVSLGLLPAPTGGWRATMSRAGSGLALLSPLVLGYAFFVEGPRVSPERPFTLLGVVLAALGVMAQLPSTRRAP